MSLMDWKTNAQLIQTMLDNMNSLRRKSVSHEPETFFLQPLGYPYWELLGTHLSDEPVFATEGGWLWPISLPRVSWGNF
jgi:hypothetical protein